MKVQHSEIYNGKIRLHTVYTDKFKMSRFSINFITKSDIYRTPLYKLMISVMMRGSEKYPTITDINKALDERYGTSVSYRTTRVGNKTVFKISCKLLNQKYVFDGDNTKIFDEILEILSDILMHPKKDGNGLLLSSYVESEKRIAVDAVNAKINDPKSYASEQCSKHMFKDSEYESYGDDADLINSFTVADLTAHMQKFYGESKIECFYIGNEVHENVARLIEKKLDICGDFNSKIEYFERALNGTGLDVKYIEEEKEVSQGRLVLGYRCQTVLSDGDYYSMALCNEIFGGGSVSKLFMNVREKKSLCYYCYSSLHSSTGTIKVGCGIDPSKKEEVFAEVGVQLNAMKDGDFTDAEIETARQTIVSGIKQIKDSPASMEAYLLRRMLAGNEDTPDETLKKISAVTRDDIIAAANKIKLDTVYFLAGTECGEDGDYE